ncbi:MAG: hypothetical protein IPM79_01800 [Polyangiaceae bacterium]|nr:hypothetical protein [Polyangiaceae bacterium]
MTQMRGARHGIGLLLIVAAVGFASCREPTQIKLELSTDADCPDQPGRPRLNDVVILTSKVIEVGTPGNPKPAPPVNAETDMCSGSGSYKTVGSLVLLPDGSDNPTVDVLIAAGVQRDETDDTANSMTAGQCAGLVFEGSSIEGLPCIIARRRLTFVDHKSLQLPIELDKACIGEDCGADLTCYRGNCVSPDISCPPDQAECAAPKGCDEECEELCGSGTGGCVDGECAPCEACDPAECAGKPCAVGAVGLCVDEASCECVSACDPAACQATGGTCDGAVCVSPTCTPEECTGPCGTGGLGTRQCIDVDGVSSCVCLGACDDLVCGASECPDAGQEPDCTTIPRGEACVCSCDDTACEVDCESGCGACVAGACGCTAACSLSDCGACIKGEIPQCAETCGGCDCVCNNDECSADCVAEGGNVGGTCGNDGACDCIPISGSGGGGNGAGVQTGGGGFGASQPSGGGGYDGANGGGGFGASEPSGGGGMGGGSCPAVQPTCLTGQEPVCNSITDLWECVCSEALCDAEQGPACGSTGLLSTCYGAPPDNPCVCYCDATACDDQCAPLAGMCQGTIGGTCMCGGGGGSCADAFPPDCGMCDAACSALDPMCTGGPCADLGGATVTCDCVSL